MEDQGDQPGEEEEEDHVTDGARHGPDQEQKQRQRDELDPARDLQLRGRLGRHRDDDTALAVRLRSSVRPPAWDWRFEDGFLAAGGTSRFPQTPSPGPHSRPGGSPAPRLALARYQLSDER